jgi:hypothetical protein
MKTRAIEVARAWCGSEGDSGEWDTAYYDIPIDTPEDKIEEVALAECRREIAASTKAAPGYEIIERHQRK